MLPWQPSVGQPVRSVAIGPFPGREKRLHFAGAGFGKKDAGHGRDISAVDPCGGAGGTGLAGRRAGAGKRVAARSDRLPRALQGAGRDRHQYHHRQLYGSCRQDRSPPQGRRVHECGHHPLCRARISQGRRAGRHPAGQLQDAEADPAARPYRRRRRQSRRLDSRSLHAFRGRRLFLRPRHLRHEGDGRHLDTTC